MLFPDFDDTLRQGFRRETELFFDSVIREDRSLLSLLEADYTFLNDRLARHYGIPGIQGSHFRRVTDRRREPARAARTREHPDDYVAPGADLAGLPRQVDSRQPARHAAAGAAAQRAAAAGKDRRLRGADAVDARADGAASRKRDLRDVPRDDRPARLRARTLRSDRPLARGRRELHDHRRLGRAARRHEVRWRRRSCARRWPNSRIAS